MSFPVITAAGETHTEANVNYLSAADGPGFVWLKVAGKPPLTTIRDAITAVDTEAASEKAVRAELDLLVPKADIVDDRISTDVDKPLSANQGKLNKDETDAHIADTVPHVPAGGTAGQHLTKIDAVDGNTQWSSLQISAANAVVGTGAPANSLGNDGDYYRDLSVTTGNDGHGPKAAGVWPAATFVWEDAVPPSTTIPIKPDDAIGLAGASTQYSRGDHKHPKSDPLTLAEMIQRPGDAEYDAAKSSDINVQGLDAWGMSRRMRRVFDTDTVFDYTALNYSDRTAVFVRNSHSSNGIDVVYGAGGTVTRHMTYANGYQEDIAGENSYPVQPREIAVMEKDGNDVYVSVFPGERVSAFGSYVTANAAGPQPHDGIVLIRDTGEAFARITGTNSVLFPSDGQPNADWFKIGKFDDSVFYPGNNGLVTVNRRNAYYLDETPDLGVPDSEGLWLEIGQIQIDKADFDVDNPAPVIYTRYVSIVDPVNPSIFLWLQEGERDTGGRTQYSFYASERLEAIFFTISDYRDNLKNIRFERHSLTLDELSTGNADWVLDPANAPAGYTRLTHRIVAGTSGYDFTLDWKVVNGEYQFTIDDRHNWNTQAGTEGWGRYGAVRDIVYKYVAVDPVKPTWEALTAYPTGSVVIGKAPAGVTEAQDSWYVMEAVIDRPNTIAALDATEWNATNWTFTPLVPTKQDIIVDLQTQRPDPVTVLVGSQVRVVNDGSRNGVYLAVGASEGQSAVSWKNPEHTHEYLENILVHVRSAGTNAGSAVQITFADDDGVDYPPEHWTVSTLSGGLESYTGHPTVNIPTVPYTGNVGIAHNKDGYLQFNYVGDAANGLSAITYAGTNGAEEDGEIIINFAGTDYNVTFPNKASVTPTYWSKQEQSSIGKLPVEARADGEQQNIGISNQYYQNDTEGSPPAPVVGEEYVTEIVLIDRGDTAGNPKTKLTRFIGVDRGNGPEWLETESSTGSGLRGEPVSDKTALANLPAKDFELRKLDDGTQWVFKEGKTAVGSDVAAIAGNGAWEIQLRDILKDGYSLSLSNPANESGGNSLLSFNPINYAYGYDPKGIGTGTSITFTEDMAGEYYFHVAMTSGSSSGRIEIQVNGVAVASAQGQSASDNDSGSGLAFLNVGDVLTLRDLTTSTTYGVHFAMMQTKRFVDEAQYIETGQVIPITNHASDNASGSVPRVSWQTQTSVVVPADGDYIISVDNSFASGNANQAIYAGHSVDGASEPDEKTRKHYGSGTQVAHHQYLRKNLTAGQVVRGWVYHNSAGTTGNEQTLYIQSTGGLKGDKGNDGVSPELQNDGTNVQWRKEGTTDPWNDLFPVPAAISSVLLAELTGTTYRASQTFTFAGGRTMQDVLDEFEFVYVIIGSNNLFTHDMTAIFHVDDLASGNRDIAITGYLTHGSNAYHWRMITPTAGATTVTFNNDGSNMQVQRMRVLGVK